MPELAAQDAIRNPLAILRAPAAKPPDQARRRAMLILRHDAGHMGCRAHS